ncbi:hypothetical protein [Nonomuraea africana]|uniref:hypothetical protein n=1 Tax=Nonomuraea africana TaxID=46171 RepID=UPI00340CA2AE
MTSPDDDLEAELMALADFVDLPAVPPPAEVAAAVRARIEEPEPAPSPPVRRRRRWRLVAAVAIVVVALTAATPQGRAAVVHILRLAGIEVRVGEAGTPPATAVPLPGEREVSLAEARRLAGFPVKVPAELGEPERVTVSDGDRIVSLFWADGVRLDQFEGLTPYFVKQLSEPWPESVGANGWWIAKEHTLSRLSREDGSELPLRLAGPTLIWFDGDLAHRLEGVTAKQRAVEIANSLR